MLELIKRLFAYDAWANARALGASKDAQSRTALAPLAHLLTSEKIWLMRLRAEGRAPADTDFITFVREASS